MKTPTPALSKRMKSQVAEYMLRTGASKREASLLARTGMLTVDGRKKVMGGKAPKRGEPIHSEEVSREDQAYFLNKFGDGVRLCRDDKGYYVAMRGIQSDRYRSVRAIPRSIVERIECSG